MKLRNALMPVAACAMLIGAAACQSQTASDASAPMRPGAAAGDEGPIGDKGTGMQAVPANINNVNPTRQSDGTVTGSSPSNGDNGGPMGNGPGK